jgi:hypothetical protein
MKYHLKAIQNGQIMFGPTDIHSGAYQHWLEARRKEGDRTVDAFDTALRKAHAEWSKGERWPLDPSGQQLAMLELFEMPEPVTALMRKRLGLSGLQPAPVEVPKDLGMLRRAETQP